ncbi:hypothetical protein BKA64DRAFT_754168 [Cadophora sp. MPI-SDFR-AT-0126]|nr:hypothetical protein BKA64DRAFT_754168 [Leotiomycetes sp. MPI-SDFR-AT-0126]
MARPKYTEAEARDMVKKELLWRKPIKFPRPGGGYYGDSDTEIDDTSSDDQSSIDFDDPGEHPCYLLRILPLVLKTIIYRILFHRPTAIVPGPIRYKCSIGWRNKPVVPIYSYQWNDRRQNGYEERSLPKYDGSYDNLQISWRSRPTTRQARLVETGVVSTNSLNEEQELPGRTYNEDLDAQVSHYICRRGSYPVQIINRTVVKIAGIQGISLLGTCKQILSECRAVLYGENTFVFDTRGQDPYTHHRGIHAHDAFERFRHQVPGLPRENGFISQRNTDQAIIRMFDKNARHQSFMSRDPLTKFFRTIGRESAQTITKVIIEGFFRTAEEIERYKHKRPLGFGRILPIYTTILKNVCLNLRKLTLHQGYNNALWDDDLDGAMRLTDEERVDSIVGQVVNILSSLQELQLGNYHFVPSDETIVEQWDCFVGRKSFGLDIISGVID